MPKKSKTTDASSSTVISSLDSKATRASARTKKVVERLGFGEGLKPTAKRRAKSVSSKSKAIKKVASPKKNKAAKRKAKKEKDPNKPKRPMSAFFFYAQDSRDRIKKDNPAAGIGEVGRILGEEWKKITEPQKKKYITQAEKAKKDYDKEIEEYNKKKMEEKKK